MCLDVCIFALSIIIMIHQQKNELQKRIKKLEEEIIQRTRNYMYQHSLSKSRRKDSQTSRGSQTDIIEQRAQKSDDSSPTAQTVKSFCHEGVSPKKLTFDSERGFSPSQSLDLKISSGIQWLNNAENKDETLEEMTKKIIHITEENEVYRQNNQRLEVSLGKFMNVEQILNEKLNSANNRFVQMERALLETEQSNYRLRLTIRSLEQELKAKEEIIDNFNTRENEFKIKIEQMQVIKKQYLKAYSKAKQEKQTIELILLQVKQGKSINLQKPLESISEETEEHIDEAIRASNADNSLGAIKNFMERSLIESNRPTMEKLITVSINKLDQMQNDNQNKITEIHESYRNLVKKMGDSFKSQIKCLEKQFESVMQKAVAADLRISRSRRKNQNIAKSGSPAQRNSLKGNSFKLDDEEQDDELCVTYTNTRKSCRTIEEDNSEQRERQKNWELLCQLCASQTKCVGLQEKYDKLVLQMSQSKFKRGEGRFQEDFKQIMDKVVEFHKAGYESYGFRSDFVQICEKVFKIISNLPTGDHGQVYFAPTNLEELEQALDVLMRFSQSYDRINEENKAETKKDLSVLETIFSQLLGNCQICEEWANEVFRKNKADQSPALSQFLRQLIEKIRVDSRSNVLSIGSVISFGHKASVVDSDY